MRIGELRHRVTIQSKSVTRNSFGDEVIAWVDLATLWAKVETLTGREFIEQAKAGAEVTHKITLRSRDDVAPTMQVVYETRLFEVAAVLRDNLNRSMTLMCSESV